MLRCSHNLYNSFTFAGFYVFFKFYIGVYLINDVLVSSVQKIDLVIHIYFFRFFSLMGYYKILSIIPCAIQ